MKFSDKMIEDLMNAEACFKALGRTCLCSKCAKALGCLCSKCTAEPELDWIDDPTPVPRPTRLQSLTYRLARLIQKRRKRLR